MEWHSKNELPEPYHWCIVEDENGNQHEYHMHNGICWYDYIIHEGICDWRSDVNIQRWKYDTINRLTVRCRNYCGVSCVNGTCPIANRDEYIERDIPVVWDCDYCHYYEGCKDCYFFENPECYCDGHGNFREDE